MSASVLSVWHVGVVGEVGEGRGVIVSGIGGDDDDAEKCSSMFAAGAGSGDERTTGAVERTWPQGGSSAIADIKCSSNVEWSATVSLTLPGSLSPLFPVLLSRPSNITEAMRSSSSFKLPPISVQKLW